MKALSLWQPWASLMATGFKTVETRGWSTNYRGQLVIHAASRRLGPGEYLLLQDWVDLGLLPDSWLKRDYPLGCCVAVVELVSCPHTEELRPEQRDRRNIAFGDFRPGRWAWLTREPRKIMPPLPWRGSRGLFEVPDELLAKKVDAKP